MCLLPDLPRRASGSYFDCIDICKVRRDWHEVRLTGVLPPLSSPQHLGAYLLTVSEPAEVELTLFQQGQRNSEKSVRLQLDLCVAVFRAPDRAPFTPGKLVQHSRRQVGAEQRREGSDTGVAGTQL